MELSHTFSNSVKQPTVADIIIRSLISILLLVVIANVIISPIVFMIISNNQNGDISFFFYFLLILTIIMILTGIIINIIFLIKYLGLMKIKGDYYFTINDGKVTIRTKLYNYTNYEYDLYLNEIYVSDIKTVNKCKNNIGLKILFPWVTSNAGINSLFHPAANQNNLYYLNLKYPVPITYNVYQHGFMTYSDIYRQYQNDFTRTSACKKIILDIPDIDRFNTIIHEEFEKKKGLKTHIKQKKKST